MTDLSSDEPEIEAIADMAGELIHTKMEMARKDTQMVHVMRIGTFSIELVPAKDINPEEIFNKLLDKLMKKYDDRLLQISIQQIKPDGDIERSNRHYG